MNKLHHQLFNEVIKQKFENLVLLLAILGFFAHLILIFVINADILQWKVPYEDLFDNPISAIYTPFSFILIYEIYLLIYYLPSSFTNSIGKQYEVISLIEIRNIFKDISRLELQNEWFAYEDNIIFTIDIIGFLILFYLIYWFNRLKNSVTAKETSLRMKPFVRTKQGLAVLLFFVLAGLIVFNFGNWLVELLDYQQGLIRQITNLNYIFYTDFFTALIIVDVIILIYSFKYTEKYSLLIRNSGFVISTILIRLSFGSGTYVTMSLIVFATLFGVLIARIYLGMARDERDSEL
ncbi:MAG: hypothetical protein ACLFUB_18850 [Cyclobacteriaceae bacterium]